MKIERAMALSIVLFMAASALGAANAAAGQHRYAGTHPLPDDAGGVYCYIEAPHVHVYAPQRPKVLYRDYHGWHHFVGDPTPHGYEGPRHTYHGAHPIAVDARVEVHVESPEYIEYCYIEGPHYHGYEPVVADFEVKGDVYWYVGDYPPHFHERRPSYARINGVYAEVEYERPVVTITPPAAYVDVLVVGVDRRGPPPHARGRARGHVGGRARVGGGVHVEVPVPTVEIRGSIGVGTSSRARPHRKHKHRKYKHRKYKHRKYRGR
jgi:hypothetical protein